MKKILLALAISAASSHAMAEVEVGEQWENQGWLGDAGDAIGKAAGDVGRTVGNAGRDISAEGKRIGDSISDGLAGLDPNAWAHHIALSAAQEYKNTTPNANHSDCLVIVTAVCAYESSKIGGAWGAALGAGGGAAMADWACNAALGN